ncbi:DIP1984 family protein [Amycolatopsis japonica]
MLVEAQTALDELESLIQRINRTNAATPLGEGTITDAIARRDALRLRHGVKTAQFITTCRSRRVRAGTGPFHAFPVSQWCSRHSSPSRGMGAADRLCAKVKSGTTQESRW